MSRHALPLGRLVVAAAALAAGALLTTAPVTSPASAAVVTLPAAALTTTAGGTGGQPASVLSVKDQSGSQNDWNKYVELTGTFSGYTSHQLPAGVAASDLTALTLDVNFLGPDRGTQTWTWSVYDWQAATWRTLGTNPATGGWSSWQSRTWSAPAPGARFASGSGEIRIRVRANNFADAMDVDYQAVSVTTASGGGTGGRWTPTPQDRWSYQLGVTNPDTTLCAAPYSGGACVRPTVWAFDLYDGAAVNTTGVAEVHAVGGKAVCYVSGGTWEDWRPDAGSFPAVGAGGPVQGGPNGQPWPGEFWFDIRQLSQLEPLMAARAQKCADAGFDAIDWDNVDAYANNTGLPLSSTQQLTYNRMLARIAHERGLSVGLKNDLDQIPQLVGDFDFAVNEQCQQYSECPTLNPFLAAGKAVVQIEYDDAPELDDNGNVVVPAPTRAEVCGPANAAGRSAIYTRVDLDQAAPWRPCR